MKKSQKVAKKSQEYYCKSCDYITCNKYDFTKHQLTIKHSIRVISTLSTSPATEKSQKSQKHYPCNNCTKIYKDKSGLWKHNKKCIVENTIENNTINCNYYNTNNINNNDNDNNDNDNTNDTLINYLMKENNEFKEMLFEQNKIIMEICKNRVTNTNSNNINSNNKTFNLNLFLNEKCKDAMNITDFVDSLKIQLSDLENVGKLGYVDGITNIIVKKLKALDVYKRPVHCSDSKREILYVKDEDKWEKENDDKVKLKRVIKDIAHKNTKLITEWKQHYPECVNSDSSKSDEYNHIIIESMGGRDLPEINEIKILKKIAQNVLIEKE